MNCTSEAFGTGACTAGFGATAVTRLIGSAGACACLPRFSRGRFGSSGSASEAGAGGGAEALALAAGGAAGAGVEEAGAVGAGVEAGGGVADAG